MAIKIPSKNIYEINNPKIRDNVIDNVSVEQTVITPSNDYDISVCDRKIEILDFEKTQKETLNEQLSSSEKGTTWEYMARVYAFVSYSNQKTFSTQVKIPVVEDNKWISNIKTGTYTNETKEKENNIKVLLYGTVEKGSASAKIYPRVEKDEDKIEDLTFYSPTTSDTKNFYIPKNIKETFSTVGLTAEATQSIIDVGSNISTTNYSIQTINNIDYYVFDLIIFCDCRILRMRGAYGDVYPKPNPYAELTGEYENFIAKQVEITFYGNTIGIDLTDGSITYGSGKHPHSLVKNELLQDSANVKTEMKNDSVGAKIGGELRSYENTSYLEMFTSYNFNIGDIITNSDGTETAEITDYDSSYGYYEIKATTNGYFYQNMNKNVIVKYSYYQQERLTQHLANNVLNQYAKGKETATLLCSISDYYDESGEKVIDTKTENMSFRLHDEVIPYVFGANGQDQPMSHYQDGKPKVFEVVGSNIIYDGAVWQEISLQEK